MKTKLSSLIVKTSFIVLIAFALGSPMAFAQATRTWVSGVGDDVNPGSRTAPCKTFAGAISKTAVGGEINAIDPGGFGALTITKSITVDGTGTFASVLASGTNGIVINTAGVVVNLRNLEINGAGTGLNGINILAATEVNIENVVIYGFTQKGINIAPTTGCRVNIKNCVVRQCANAVNGGAVHAHPGAGGTLKLNISKTSLLTSQFGFRCDSSLAVLDDCVISGNNAEGVVGASGKVSVNRCTISNNGTTGVVSLAAAATVHINDNAIFANSVGINVSSGGILTSFGTNRIHGNTTDFGPGAPTNTIATQ